jgi:hypothetical protein
MQDAILQLLVVAAPAIALYFTGWSFLYTYLEEFGINISEFSFDLPNIFIYSYPPLRMLWEVKTRWVVGLALAVALAALLASVVWKFRVELERYLFRPLFETMRFFWQLPNTLWALCLLLALVLVLPFPIKSVTAWAARRAAAQVWDTPSTILTPHLKSEKSTEVELLLGSLLRDLHGKPPADNDDRLLADFRECEKRHELGLIFSSTGHYYLLCRAADVPSIGTVFEVTSTEGLVSSRSAFRSNVAAGRDR